MGRSEPGSPEGTRGHHVEVSAHVYADKGQIHVMSVKMLKGDKHGQDVVCIAPNDTQGRHTPPFFFILALASTMAHRCKHYSQQSDVTDTLLVFLIVFAEAVGLPVPAALALVAGGAAAASGLLHLHTLLLLAVPRCCRETRCFVRDGALHGMGSARISVQALGQPGNLHPALGRIFLQTRQSHPAVRQVYSRNQHHGSASRRQHEDAA